LATVNPFEEGRNKREDLAERLRFSASRTTAQRFDAAP